MDRRKAVRDAFEKHRLIPFSWNGNGHCLSFPADVALAITGKDPIAQVRGRFSSEREALELMLAHGCKSLSDIARKLFPEIPIVKARAGDWALVKNADGTEGMGVIIGHQIAVRAQAGMGIVPLTWAVAAYRVD